MKRLAFIFLFILNLLCSAFAGELVQFAPSARSMALGGTGISYTIGAEATYVNPAFLQQQKGFDFLIAQISGAWSLDAQRLVEQYNNSSATLGPPDIANLANKNNFANVSVKSAFAMPYFTVGAYSNNYLMEIFRENGSTTYNAHFISDYGYVIGGAF